MIHIRRNIFNTIIRHRDGIRLRGFHPCFVFQVLKSVYKGGFYIINNCVQNGQYFIDNLTKESIIGGKGSQKFTIIKEESSMKFFIDTANLEEIAEMSAYGIVDGVTTNPSIIAREGKDLKETLIRICNMVDGPISGEVLAPDAETMIKEGLEIAGWHRNMVVKIPMTPEGIKAVRALSAKGIRTNVTTVYDSAQALVAAKAGATYVSPFVGRSDDVLMDGLGMLAEISLIYRIHNIKTEIIAASMRTPAYVVGAAKAGADIATIPYECMKKLFWHPMTDVSLDGFMSDWKKAMGDKKIL